MLSKPFDYCLLAVRAWPASAWLLGALGVGGVVLAEPLVLQCQLTAQRRPEQPIADAVLIRLLAEHRACSTEGKDSAGSPSERGGSRLLICVEDDTRTRNRGRDELEHPRSEYAPPVGSCHTPFR